MHAKESSGELTADTQRTVERYGGVGDPLLADQLGHARMLSVSRKDLERLWVIVPLNNDLVVRTKPAKVRVYGVDPNLRVGGVSETAPEAQCALA